MIMKKNIVSKTTPSELWKCEKILELIDCVVCMGVMYGFVVTKIKRPSNVYIF